MKLTAGICWGRLRLILAVLFAVSQLLPAGSALAKGGEGLSLVICTSEGVKTVSWEEATGEASPFNAPAQDEHSGKSACHACAAGACSGGVARILPTFAPYATLMQPAPSGVADELVFIRTNAGPPPPSRAPPVLS